MGWAPNFLQVQAGGPRGIRGPGFLSPPASLTLPSLCLGRVSPMGARLEKGALGSGVWGYSAHVRAPGCGSSVWSQQKPGFECWDRGAEGRRPKPAGLYAPHGPASRRWSPTHPTPPRCVPHGGTQESHQLPVLSRGLGAPRTLLAGSLEAVSSSSSSSPSVYSSWPGP